MREVKRWVKGNLPTKQDWRGCPACYKEYFRQLQSLHFNDGGVLMMKQRGGITLEDQRDQIVIPNQENLWQMVFYWSHVHPLTEHFGRSATIYRAKIKFYWPNMFMYLKRQIETCNMCLAKIQNVNNKQTEHRPQQHGTPSQILYVHIVGPFEVNAIGE